MKTNGHSPHKFTHFFVVTDVFTLLNIFSEKAQHKFSFDTSLGDFPYSSRNFKLIESCKIMTTFHEDLAESDAIQNQLTNGCLLWNEIIKATD